MGARRPSASRRHQLVRERHSFSFFAMLTTLGYADLPSTVIARQSSFDMAEFAEGTCRAQSRRCGGASRDSRQTPPLWDWRPDGGPLTAAQARALNQRADDKASELLEADRAGVEEGLRHRAALADWSRRMVARQMEATKDLHSRWCELMAEEFFAPEAGRSRPGQLERAGGRRLSKMGWGVASASSSWWRSTRFQISDPHTGAILLQLRMEIHCSRPQ